MGSLFTSQAPCSGKGSHNTQWGGQSGPGKQHSHTVWPLIQGQPPTYLPNNPLLLRMLTLPFTCLEPKPFRKKKFTCAVIINAPMTRQSQDPKVLTTLFSLPLGSKYHQADKEGGLWARKCSRYYKIFFFFLSILTVLVCGQLGFLLFQHKFVARHCDPQANGAVGWGVLSSEMPSNAKIIRKQ